MVAPIIHLNGTSRDMLIENLSLVYDSLETSAETLKAAAPNRRDYYPGPPSLWEEAVDQHMRRLKIVRDLQDDIEAEMRAISDA